MKEIITIIRPKKVNATKDALAELGLPSMTAIPVLGRGKQKGIASEVNIEYRPGVFEQSKSSGMKYIPKRYLSIVVKDELVDKIIQTITDINKTGQIGDGKIFVCPVDDVLRIRTDETGEAAVD